MQTVNPQFNSEKLPKRFIGRMITLNSRRISNILLADPDIEAGLLHEHSLMKFISSLIKSWQSYLVDREEKISGYSRPLLIDFDAVIMLASNNNNLPLVQVALSHPNANKLYSSIISENVDGVREALTLFDPRNNSNKAYKLALYKNNKEITEAISSTISKRFFYERQVFINQIEKLIGPNDLAEILYSKVRAMF